jgi:hypothetical protein
MSTCQSSARRLLEQARWNLKGLRGYHDDPIPISCDGPSGSDHPTPNFNMSKINYCVDSLSRHSFICQHKLFAKITTLKPKTRNGRDGVSPSLRRPHFLIFGSKYKTNGGGDKIHVSAACGMNIVARKKMNIRCQECDMPLNPPLQIHIQGCRDVC